MVLRPPAFGTTLVKVDDSAALKVPGVEKVVRTANGAAVIASHFWAAKLGRDALKAEWTKPEGGGVTGTIPGKKRIRRWPPCGRPITTSTLRPSMASVPSSVQRIEASVLAATRACDRLARNVGTATRLAISASR